MVLESDTYCVIGIEYFNDTYRENLYYDEGSYCGSFGTGIRPIGKGLFVPFIYPTIIYLCSIKQSINCFTSIVTTLHGIKIPPNLGSQ